MPKTNTDHSNLLNKAARSVLRPLGLIQKGRSRTWFDDNGWWLGVVEFQPSSWSRGSYLNVGCNWLWVEKDYLSFDEGYRVEGFTEFKNINQFSAVAAALADRAATEMKRYRLLFQSVQMVSDYYIGKNPNGFWPSFHAAMACGIAGRVSAAHSFFVRVIETEDDRDWVFAARAEAKRLDSVVTDTEAFRKIVIEKVARARQLLKLPTRDVVIFEGSP
jgi:hypothetical protein